MLQASLHDRNLVALYKDDVSISENLEHHRPSCTEPVGREKKVAIAGLGVEALRVGRADPAILVEKYEAMIVSAQDMLNLVSHELVFGDRDCGFRFCGEVV